MILLSQIAGLNLRAALGRARRQLGIRTETETRDAYLSEARDRVDLERRLHDLDGRDPSSLPRNFDPFRRHR